MRRSPTCMDTEESQEEFNTLGENYMDYNIIIQ